jgi:hypothetical protein
MESLATAASPKSCNPIILWIPPIEDIVFDEIPSMLQGKKKCHIDQSSK